MGAINRIPRGLLSFVDTQTQGLNPAFLGENVSPTLDMEPFYRSLVRYEIQSLNTPLGGPGNYSSVITVPTNEVWLCHNVNAQLENNTGVIGAGLRFGINAFSIAGVGINPSVGLFHSQVGAAGITLAIGDIYWGGSTFDRPVVLSPGWGVGLWLNLFTGAPTLNVTLNLTVNRCQI